MGGLVAAAAWLLVMGTVSVITFCLPKTYASTTRIHLQTNAVAPDKPLRIQAQLTLQTDVGLISGWGDASDGQVTKVTRWMA